MKKIALWATHISVLTRAFDVSKGDVVEVGTGFFSSTLLDWLCAVFDRKLVSYETNEHWFNIAKRKQSDYHDVIFVKNWDDIPLLDRHWGLAFIDHDPALRRAVDAGRLKDHADYVVIHDSEPQHESIHNYESIYPLFKYRYDYKKVVPWTTVLSNFYSLEKFEC